MSDQDKQFGLQVPKDRGEKFRKLLCELDFLDNKSKIKKAESFLILPLKKGIHEDDVVKLVRSTDQIEVVQCDFERINTPQAGDYRQYLSDIGSELLPFLPSSFDVVGDLCIVKLQDEVVPHANLIAAAIMRSIKNVSGVFLDHGVTGEFRIRSLKRIGGVNRTVTLHREFGMKLRVDIAQVYFSPRLAGERNRIANLIHVGGRGGEGERNENSENYCTKPITHDTYETIFDMFAGVGPFSIGIARKHPNTIIHAIDSNPVAIKLIKENLTHNKITNVIPHYGDARKITENLFRTTPFQRIIMNLPHHAIDFLDLALKVIENGFIHLYTICHREDLPEIMSYIRNISHENKRSVKNIQTTELKGYSATEAFFVHDIHIKKMI